MEKYLYYLWIGQLLNLYGMALVKLSICAYIFMLKFSKGFNILIWISVVLHVGINLIFPTVILFGECTVSLNVRRSRHKLTRCFHLSQPYTKHWKSAQSGSCWSAKPRIISGYSGAATNILTDLIYTAAPLVYIGRVQLNKRTVWGVRLVFLLGLM